MDSTINPEANHARIVKISERGRCVYHPETTLNATTTIERFVDHAVIDIAVTVSCPLCSVALVDGNAETRDYRLEKPAEFDGQSATWQNVSHRERQLFLLATMGRNMRLGKLPE